MSEVWDREVDVVILGAGPAGMTAAIVAQSQGLEALLLEKTDQVGGTAAWSLGMMWFVDTNAMRAAGFTDSIEKAERYLRVTVGDTVAHRLQESYLHQGRIALDYMLQHSELRVAALDYPDYYPERDGGMFGRAHAPLAFDGRRLGRHFKALRAPMAAFAPFGGMMMDFDDISHFMAAARSPRSLWHVAKMLGRHARDRIRYHRGTRLVAGNALVGRLFKTLLDRDVPLWLETRAEQLLIEEGRVTGLIVERKGEKRRVRARRGVVIATGGYPSNMEMRRAHSRQPTVERSIALPDNLGDGIALGEAAGGRLDRNSIDTGYYTPISELPLADGNRLNVAHFALDRTKPGFIAVGADGHRFTNEAASYHEFTLGMFEAGAVPAYLVADAAAVKKYGIGAVLPGGWGLRKFEKSGYLHSAPTLAELAEKIGVNAANLRWSTERNNQFATTGIDEDFGKGRSKYDHFFADHTHAPNPCLGPITKAPFYAIRMWPGDFGTSRGLVTGDKGEVLDAQDHPIAGLYACGNDMNSPVGGQYIGAGITLGPAITFGYLAAMALAADRAPLPSQATGEPYAASSTPTLQ